MSEPIFSHRRTGGSAHLKGEASRCFLTGEQTGGLFSLTESVMQPGTEQAPLHVHTREDETFYVIEGKITAVVGDQQRDLGPGESVWLPRGVPHRIHTTGDRPVRVLMLLTPAGLEKFFDEIDAMHADGELDREVMARTAQKYGVTILGDAGGAGGQEPPPKPAPGTPDPDAKAVLDELVKLPPPPNGQTDAERLAAGRAGYRAQAPAAGKPEAVATVAHRVVPGPAGDIPVRVYAPTADAPLPVLVYFHGGSFVMGDLDTHDTPLRAIANRVPCVVVSVGYRLAPEHPFPAAPDDCYAATEWVAQHAAELGGDPKRVAVGGDSAGGTLAAAVTLMCRDKGGPTLTYQLLVYPNTDLAPAEPYPSWGEYDGKVLTRTEMDRSIALYVPREADRRNPYASPLWATAVGGLPPALVVTGECDPLRDEGEAYASRLTQAGVAVEARRYDGMIHGFFQMAGRVKAGGRLIDDAAVALRKALGT